MRYAEAKKKRGYSGPYLHLSMQWKHNMTLTTPPGYCSHVASKRYDMSAGSHVECTKLGRRRRLLISRFRKQRPKRKMKKLKEKKNFNKLNSVTELNCNLWPECYARQMYIMCWGCRGDVFWMFRSDLRYRRRKYAREKNFHRGWQMERYKIQAGKQRSGNQWKRKKKKKSSFLETTNFTTRLCL